MENKPEVQASDSSASATHRELVAFSLGRGGIIGVKAGMTQVYTEDGDSVAVTVIDLRPAVITQVKTKDKNGYQSIQVGMLEKKVKAANKPEQGHAKKVGVPGFYHYQEFRIADSDKLDGLTLERLRDLQPLVGLVNALLHDRQESLDVRVVFRQC